MKAKFINESSYWDNSSPYAAEQEDFFNELVPASGAADTLQGEILRNISRIQYDYLNNGFGNNKGKETRFLDNHSKLFKQYMKDPNVWDQFAEAYRMVNYGEGVEDSESGYEEYDEDTGEYEWIDEENFTPAEEYMKNVLDFDPDPALDAIMDGIVKYVRMTKDKLIPLT